MRAHDGELAAAGDGRLTWERGFIRGVLDVVFEHAGKVYFADWKSDALPDFSAPALRAHVEINYELQIRIYTVALFRLLAIGSQAECEHRFGGLAYVFLRGLGAEGDGRAGLFVARPTFADVRRWEASLIEPMTVARAAGGGT
jgi:exodeoxyribonuclease V beta subunit